MQLVKFTTSSMAEGVGILEQGQVTPLTLPLQGLSDILETDDPAATAKGLIASDAQRLPLAALRLLAPIDRQEVWAAGVTYIRSRKARMDESVDASTFYDKVYAAPRPELFFKATPRRVSGPGEPVRIRKDTTWSVPEPELTLVLNSRLKLVGFTVGNDMSARDIEGRKPALPAAGQALRRLLRPGAVHYTGRRHAGAGEDRHSPRDPPRRQRGLRGSHRPVQDGSHV